MIEEIPPRRSRLLRTMNCVLLTALFACLYAGAQLFAQGGEATMTGTVHDPTGAVMPSAAVELLDQATGERRTAVTTDAGLFAFPALRPATYTVNVAATGFQKYERRDIKINPNQQLDLPDINMQVGSTSSTVDVTGKVDIVPTDTQEISTDLTAAQVSKLAIEGRNVIELLRLVPGAVNTGYSGQVTIGMQTGANNFAVNGVRPSGISTQLDGADVEDPGCNCGAFATPNREMVAEVNVQTSSFNAESPKGPVVFQAITKSGGRDFHGEAYYTVRDTVLNANDAATKAAGQPRPDSRYQYPGGNIGGPVLIPGTNFNKNRDKLFFFGAYEKMLQQQPNGFNRAVVPTPAMLGGDFSSALPGSSGVNVSTLPCDPTKGPLAGYCQGAFHVSPSAISPQGLALLKLFPAPNLNPNTNNGANYGANVSNEADRYQFLVRGDYNVSDKMKIYSRYNQEAEQPSRVYGLWWTGNIPYPGGIQGNNTGKSLSTSVVNIISPTLTNEVVVAVGRLNFGNTLSNPSAVDPTKVGFGSKFIFPFTQGLVPNVFFNDAYGTSFQTAGGWLNGQNPAKKWVNSAADNMSWVKGTHLMKFGAYYQFTTNDQRSPHPGGQWPQGDIYENPTGDPSSTGNSFADLLTGHVGGADQSSQSPPGILRQNEVTFYAQDTWKVNRRLTINYGLRLYHMGWMYDTNRNFAVFVPARYNGALCQTPGLYGCGSSPGENQFAGGSAPVSAYSGLLTNNTAPYVPRSGRQTPLAEFGPRFGFAYDLTGKGSTVVRAGFGSYYFHEINNPVYDAMSNPPLVQTYVAGAPTSLNQLISSSITANTPSSALVLDPADRNVPFVYEYNFTISQRLPWQSSFQASYIGNSSHNLEFQNLNQNYVPYGRETAAEILHTQNSTANVAPNDQNYRIYGNWGQISQITNPGIASYNGLQLLAQKQAGRINFMAAYTFSKALGVGNGSTGIGNGPLSPTNWRSLSYGPLSYDRTHVVQLSYLVRLPGLASNVNGFARGAVNGWEVSGITIFSSGAPLNFSNVGGLGLNVDQKAITGSPDYLAYPLLVSGCNPTRHLASHQLFNAACFQDPTPGGPNGPAELPYYIRGPFQWSSDLSVHKVFHITERQNAEFRAEAFDFLNRSMWTGYQGNIDTAGAGYENLKTGNRTVQLLVKYNF